MIRAESADSGEGCFVGQKIWWVGFGSVLRLAPDRGFGRLAWAQHSLGCARDRATPYIVISLRDAILLRTAVRSYEMF